jgi:hypothetical protein
MSNPILDRNLVAEAKEHLAKAVTCLQMLGTEPGNPGADYFRRLDANRATLGCAAEAADTRPPSPNGK